MISIFSFFLEYN